MIRLTISCPVAPRTWVVVVTITVIRNHTEEESVGVYTPLDTEGKTYEFATTLANRTSKTRAHKSPDTQDGVEIVDRCCRLLKKLETYRPMLRGWTLAMPVAVGQTRVLTI